MDQIRPRFRADQLCAGDVLHGLRGTLAEKTVGNISLFSTNFVFVEFADGSAAHVQRDAEFSLEDIRVPGASRECS